MKPDGNNPRVPYSIKAKVGDKSLFTNKTNKGSLVIMYEFTAQGGHWTFKHSLKVDGIILLGLCCIACLFLKSPIKE